MAALLALGACGSDAVGPEDVDFVDELEIDLSLMTKTASGLYIQDLTVGEGEALALGSEAVLDYGGWLPNGANFDNGTDFTISLGVDPLISGFEEGVIGMRIGGTRTLVIPPNLGYGDRIQGGIPANSTLIFRITLKAIN